MLGHSLGGCTRCLSCLRTTEYPSNISAFGLAAALLESIPIAGLFLSIPNRIGAAMWSFDMEKRQHLFAAGVIQPLQPHQVGFYGMGSVSDIGIDIQAAEKEIERKWAVENEGKMGLGEGEKVEVRGGMAGS